MTTRPPPGALEGSSSNPPRKNPPSIDRAPPCSDHHRRNPPLRSKPSIAAFLSDPASSDFPTIIVDCSSRRTTTLDRSIDRTPPCSPPLTSDSPVKPPAGDRRPHSYTGDFDLTAEEWDDFKKGHPKAASLRTIPLPFPDLCARLFDGNSATGNFRSYSTQSSSVAGASSCRVPPLQITATPFDAMDDDGVDTSHHEPPPSAASPSAASPSAGSPSAASPSAGSPYTGSPYTTTPSGNPNKRAKPSTPVAPSASPSASSPDGTSVTANDLAFEMKKALQSLTKGYTIPQCLEKLEVLQLGPTDPLRFVAYHIFGGTMNMREMWMHLPDVPEILRGWLEMTGTSLGVLKDGKIVR
ncbi:unnamed protein product [Lactuca saligna]|uniref:Uncharacterized protein n=1 Tax=Lactuca saligna TaxID=75948 RepID=A0AA35VF15_LACSI|nr:unnamed protein product [Lactuca saligna]